MTPHSPYRARRALLEVLAALKEAERRAPSRRGWRELLRLARKTAVRVLLMYPPALVLAFVSGFLF